ncbi:MAG: alpha/beta fold hydrolase [Pseudomonadota bacterium]
MPPKSTSSEPVSAPGFEIRLLGELRVICNGDDVLLPASRKARALLAYLAATGRPHRRERLCELLWDLPNDPKAALRWSLSKLRKVVDGPERVRMIADRERVAFNTEDALIDVHDVRDRLRQEEADVPINDLEEMADRLGAVLLDGLDGAGDEAFDSWLAAEREDVHTMRIQVVRRLATHPDMPSIIAAKWMRLWQDADPEGAEQFRQTHASKVCSGLQDPSETASSPFSTTAPVVPLAASGQKTLPSHWAPPALRSQRIGFCEVSDQTKIAYATIGSGPPLLKAANWLTHLEFDWSSPIWGRSFLEIARKRTLVRYDERGCGLSDWDVRDLSFEAFVEDLEIVADSLGLERFPLLGISQGGAVCIEYAVRHPERVSGLVLVGSYAAGWRHTATPEEKLQREAIRTLTQVGWGTDNPAYRHIFSQTFMPDVGAEELAWFDELQRLTTSPQNAARFQDAFGDIDVRDRLSLVQTPTIVMHAVGDQRIPLEQGREVASGIPGAHFVPLKSRNHVLVDYEPAWQAFMDALNKFLTDYDL